MNGCGYFGKHEAVPVADVNEPKMLKRDLSSYATEGWQPGRTFVIRTIWYFISLLFFEHGWLPVTAPKVWLLRLFGSKIGCGVVLRPNVRIKFPWRLAVGDHSWIGRDVWIENLADVIIGADVCVSQGAYFCTGSHNCRSNSFDLRIRPIVVEHGAWIAARSVVLGGVTVGNHSVVAACSMLNQDLPALHIAMGVPASYKPIGHL